MFARLRDSDRRVRKQCLMVLTHLILNDMLKVRFFPSLNLSLSACLCVSVVLMGGAQVRANVSEIALCLEDAVPAIADTAHLFFTELSKKSTLCSLSCQPVYLYLTVWV
jgi:condensin complex subunit 1